MLRIIIPGTEGWDEEKEEFIEQEEPCTLELEHSLISLSKWESKWKIPFLSKDNKTQEQTIDYIRCMTLTDDVPTTIYDRIMQYPDIVARISNYIEDPMTATWFTEEKNKPSKTVITAERIYYWMIALNIPPQYESWHLNRLMTLIRVCNIENAPAKKKSKKEIMSNNAALNAARRKKLNSKG